MTPVKLPRVTCPNAVVAIAISKGSNNKALRMQNLLKAQYLKSKARNSGPESRDKYCAVFGHPRFFFRK
jgi:hypothetical protein